MISSMELEGIGRIRGLQPRYAELSYLQHLFLYALSSSVGSELVFKGGTCLQLVWGLNRFSEDLDFSQVGPLDCRKAVDECLSKMSRFGAEGRVSGEKKFGNSQLFSLMFRGPLYETAGEAKLGVDVNLRTPVYEKMPATIRHPFQEFPAFDFLAMKKGEILAEKIAAVFTRTTARDLYDMDFLLSSGEKVNTALVSSKLEGYGLKFDRAAFGRRLGMMRILWKVELSPLVKNLGSFDEAKARVMKSIGK